LSGSDPTPPAGAALYSETLLALRAECPVCGACEVGTGWLIAREDDPVRWYVDMKCEGCGSRGGTWKQDWISLIESLVAPEVSEQG
jgi:hypothetical protein